MTNICSYAWMFCEIHPNGCVYPCCKDWCNKYSFGNLFKNSFEEVWNSSKAQKFRQNIEDCLYTYCDKTLCMREEYEYSAEQIKSNAINKDSGLYYPKQIKMCYDLECNVACITCRDSIIKNTPEDLKRLNLLQEKLVPVLPYIESIKLSGRGDPFGSRYAQKLMKFVSQNFPHIRFSLHTNGLLFTKKMAEKLGILDKIDDVEISIHAATAETYNKIVKYSNFEKVIKNLEWLSEEKRAGKIKKVVLTFVVSQLNYHEMPAFVELAKRFDFTPVFRACRDKASAFTEDRHSYTVWDPSHPDFNNYCNIMNNPVMKYARIQDVLKRNIDIPKISVIIPVYNVEEYLSQCLESVLNQTLKETEIICIDDGSTDNSLKILQDYAKKDNRLIVLSQKNQGAGPTRNRGIKMARGEYLSFLDADDYFEPDMLQRFYEKAKATSADITICDFWCFDDRIKADYYNPYSLQYKNLPRKKVFCAKDCPNTILNIVPSTVWSQFYRREFVMQNNLQYQNLPNHNDVYFSTIALILAERITCLTAKLIHHRKHTNSTVYNREYAFTSSYEAIFACEEFLKEKNLYETYKTSFLQKSFATIFTGTSLREPILSMWQNFMRSEVLPHFNEDAGSIASFPAQHAKIIENIAYKPNLSNTFDFFYKWQRDKIVPIAFGIRNQLDYYTVITSIQSVISHANENVFYDIYILHDLSLSTDETYWLENLSHKNIRITCMNISSDTIKSRLPIPGYASITYWQLIVPYAFFGYNKILCLENGIIFNADPAIIYKQDISQYLAAGCLDCGDKNYIEDTLGLIYENFISIDVLLLNTKIWQEKNISNMCWEFLHSANTKYLNPCREAINSVAHNQLRVLNNFYGGRIDKNSFNSVYDLDEFVLLNYTNLQPWANLNQKFTDIWWNYARKSPYYEPIFYNCIALLKENLNADHIPNVSLLNMNKVMENNDVLYPLMKEYIKEWIYAHFSFGNKRLMHRNNLEKIIEQMQKNSPNNERIML